MLACIPSNGNAGRDDSVCSHFGSAPYFTLYDSESHEVTVVENRNSHHSHGTCHPMNQLAGYHIDAVVCGGMGRRAIEALSVEGIRVIDAGADSVNEVIERIDRGDLIDMDARQACRGHGQHQTADVAIEDHGRQRMGGGRNGRAGGCHRGGGSSR